jgi:glycosyltransferase involved in cell wall biosynthesis
MKILQVIPHYVPAFRFGGPLQVAHSLAKALVQRGHEVSVCTTNIAGNSKNLEVPLDQPVDVDGVKVYYEPVGHFRAWGYSPSLVRRVELLAADANFVLVHNYFQYAGWSSAVCARTLGKPYIIFPHASLKRQSIRSSSYFAKCFYLWLLERKNYECAEYIAFNAEEELEDSVYSKNGIVVPNGVDPLDFIDLPSHGGFRSRHPQVGNKLIFLFLGRIDIKQKALDVLVKAFAIRVKAASEAVLVLAGPSIGRDQARLHNLVQHLGLSERVFFTGLISGKDKYELLRDADVFILPSRYEGSSIAVLEAMASGLPIVLSDRCGLHREIDSNGCGLVVRPEVQHVASAMVAMEDPAMRAKYGKQSRQLVLLKYSWPQIAEGLEKLMHSVIGHV